MKRLAPIVAGLALPLCACNQNTALGNDREAQIDPAPTPAPVMNAAAALQNVSTAILKPETMSDTDIAALGGLTGRCVVRFTEVSHPAFLFEPDGSGAIKMNGKLIVLSQAGSNRFESGELSVTLQPNDDEGDAGLQGMNMIVLPPGAQDEIGYSGFVQCFDGGSA